MIIRVCFSLFFFFLLHQKNMAQHRYYREPDADIIKQFRDSANRVVTLDSNSVLKKQFDYVLAFYPEMRLKHIRVKYNLSKKIAYTKPTFSSIFKLPGQREYTVYLSKRTKTTLDSVLVDNLSFNSQLGLIANQVSTIEDLSTGGFFNFIAWYFKQLTRSGKNDIKSDAELKTLEVGLGYQLLAHNRECEEKLQINNWLSTKGYANYFKHYRNRSMKPQKVLNFMSDLPVYVSNTYK